jgi:hypothetical protein
MARLVTLTTLQNRVLQRAHLPAASNGAIVSTSELLDNINEGIAEFHRLVIGIPGPPAYLESIVFNTIAGQDTYTIGPAGNIVISDFLSGKGLDVSFGSNIVNTARQFNWNERNRFKYLDPGWTYVQNVYYAFLGKPSTVAGSPTDSIKFIPQPPGSFAVTLWYIPVPVVLVNGGDTFDGINGYEEIVVLSAAIKLLLKQEQFEHANALMSERMRQETSLVETLTRNSDEPERVSDVTNLDIGYPRLRMYG